MTKQCLLETDTGVTNWLERARDYAQKFGCRIIRVQ